MIFKLLLLFWVLKQMSLHMGPLRAESRFPSPLALLELSPADFQKHFMGTHLPGADPCDKVPTVGLGPSLLRETLCL